MKILEFVPGAKHQQLLAVHTYKVNHRFPFLPSNLLLFLPSTDYAQPWLVSVPLFS